MTIGLIRHRPEEPVDFLQGCLGEARRLSPNEILWDTFLSRDPQKEDTEGIQPTHKVNTNVNGVVPLPDLREHLPADSVPVEKPPLDFHLSDDFEQDSESTASSLTMASKAKKKKYSSSPSTSMSSDGVDFLGMYVYCLPNVTF